MNCKFIDLPCHFFNGVGGLWFSLGWGWQSLIVIGVLLTIGGAVWNFQRIVKAIAGWPGVVGVGLILVAIVGAIAGGLSARGRGASDPLEQIPDDHPDAKPPLKKTKPKVRVKPKTGKRKYNPDTNQWDEV
jgi:hypothetical protein